MSHISTCFLSLMRKTLICQLDWKAVCGHRISFHTHNRVRISIHGLFRLRLGDLTSNGPIPWFDFVNDNPSQVAHSFTKDRNLGFGDLFDELGLLFLRENSLNDLYSCEWYSNFTSFFLKLSNQCFHGKVFDI